MKELVKLIAITKPIDDTMTLQDLIAYCARVSNPKNQDNRATGSKLLKYLVKNKHWSPLEMVGIVMEINCSRAIGRQILRHHSFRFQEFSQRYAEVDEDMFEKVEARMQDPKNRQNSITLNSEEYGTDTTIADIWDMIQETHIEDTISHYKHALSLGIAKEQARVILPEGLTKSKLYVSGTLRDWIFYCHLRMSNGTQLEHQTIAKECWNILLEQFPTLNDLFIGET
jgi:thymidylate synthase (FAD)